MIARFATVRRAVYVAVFLAFVTTVVSASAQTMAVVRDPTVGEVLRDVFIGRSAIELLWRWSCLGMLISNMVSSALHRTWPEISLHPEQYRAIALVAHLADAGALNFDAVRRTVTPPGAKVETVTASVTTARTEGA